MLVGLTGNASRWWNRRSPGDHLSVSLVPECLIMINNINIINSINSFIMARPAGPQTRQEINNITDYCSLVFPLLSPLSPLSPTNQIFITRQGQEGWSAGCLRLYSARGGNSPTIRLISKLFICKKAKTLIYIFRDRLIPVFWIREISFIRPELSGIINVNIFPNVDFYKLNVSLEAERNMVKMYKTRKNICEEK